MSDSSLTNVEINRTRKYAGVHMTAMLLMSILCIVSISGLTSGQIFPEENAQQIREQFPMTIMAGIITLCVNTVALFCGIIYVFNGYEKRASVFYRMFLVLAACSCAASAATSTMRYIEEFPDDNKVVQIIFLTILPMAVKTVLLLVMAFRKDLGKRLSYALFAIILLIDLLYCLLWITPGEIVMVRLTLALARLIMTSTVGMSLRGKYANKDERGTT